MKLKRAALRIGLVALLIFLGSVPIAVRYLPSAPGLVASFGHRVNALDYGSAQEEDVSPGALLAYADLAGNAVVQKGNYTEARRILGMTGSLPPNTEYNLETYVTLMQELVTTLGSAEQGQVQLRQLINNGSVNAAQEKISELRGLLDDASNLLNMTSEALYQIEDYYWPIDISGQVAQLDSLSERLGTLEDTFANLVDLLRSVDLRAATHLVLTIWPKPVEINGIMHLSARLSSDAGALPSRIVDLSINGTVMTSILNQAGETAWNYTVSSSERLSSLEVYAFFTPTGKDASIYRPASSTTQIVPIEYYPVTLTSASSKERLHVLENFTVQAGLADDRGRGLAGENLELMMDDTVVNSCKTDTAGQCSITESFPSGTPEGWHELYVRFKPESGVYAASVSEKNEVEIYYLKPTLDLVALNGPTRVGADDFAVSGQTLYVESRVELASGPLSQGLVVAYLGERELGRAFSDADGTFKMIVNLPLDATGDQPFTLVSVSGKPWITTSTTSLVLKIVNSPIVFLGIGVIVSAVMMLSGTSIDLRSILRRPSRSKKNQEPETKVEPEAKQEAAPVSIEFRLGYLRSIDDPRACVKNTYWEIRRVLAAVLNDPGQASETHREYETRINGRLSPSSSFSDLTKLYELAEYSQHPFSRLEADDGVNHAVMIAEGMNVEVK